MQKDTHSDTGYIGTQTLPVATENVDFFMIKSQPLVLN